MKITKKYIRDCVECDASAGGVYPEQDLTISAAYEIKKEETERLYRNTSLTEAAKKIIAINETYKIFNAQQIAEAGRGKERTEKMISQSYAKKVIAMEKKSWHDSAWHAFMGTQEAQAVIYAHDELLRDGRGNILAEVVEEAKKFLKATL